MVPVRLFQIRGSFQLRWREPIRRQLRSQYGDVWEALTATNCKHSSQHPVLHAQSSQKLPFSLKQFFQTQSHQQFAQNWRQNIVQCRCFNSEMRASCRGSDHGDTIGERPARWPLVIGGQQTGPRSRQQLKRKQAYDVTTQPQIESQWHGEPSDPGLRDIGILNRQDIIQF